MVLAGSEAGFLFSIKNHADPYPQIKIWPRFEESSFFIKKYIAHKPPLGSSKSLETHFSDIRGLPRTPGIPLQKIYVLYNIWKNFEKSNFLFSAREPIESQFRGHQRTQN